MIEPERSRHWVEEEDCYPVNIDNGSNSIKCALAYSYEDNWNELEFEWHDCRIEKFASIVGYMPRPIHTTGGEEIETLNSSLHEANGSNDELRNEIRCMKKEMNRPKEVKKYEEFEAVLKEEMKLMNKVQQLRKERQIIAKKSNYVMW
eukprot:950619_1